jgi:hypothetical protein
VGGVAVHPALPKRTIPLEAVGGSVEKEVLPLDRAESSVAGVQFVKSIQVIGFEGRRPREKMRLSLTCQHIPDVFTVLVPLVPLVQALDLFSGDFEDLDFDFHLKKKKLHLLCPFLLLVDVLERDGALLRYERSLVKDGPTPPRAE